MPETIPGLKTIPGYPERKSADMSARHVRMLTLTLIGLVWVMCLLLSLSMSRGIKYAIQGTTLKLSWMLFTFLQSTQAVSEVYAQIKSWIPFGREEEGTKG